MTVRVRLVVWLLVMVVPLGCGGAGLTHLKKGTKVSMSGEIDNIIHTEVPYDNEMLAVTAVGFASGQGIALIGLHPGLTKGKHIKVQAEFFENIRGTDVFRVVQIATDGVPESRPQ